MKAAKMLLTIIVLVVIGGGALFFFGQGLTDVSVERFALSGVSSISSDSFTLEGELAVRNPSSLSVPVEQVPYTIILEETGEELSTGRLSAFSLEKQSVTSVPFSHTTEWQPAASLAARLATEEEVYVRVEGTVHVNTFGIIPVTLPFSERIDIKDYILQRSGIESATEAVDATGGSGPEETSDPIPSGSEGDSQQSSPDDAVQETVDGILN